MIIDFDKNGLPMFWTGGKWFDSKGNDITTTKIAHFEQRGDVNNIAIDSVGVKTIPVTFSTPYTNTVDRVIPTLLNPSQTDHAIGGVWITNQSKTGFTLNVKVTTASVTSGATVSVHWEALGQ